MKNKRYPRLFTFPSSIFTFHFPLFNFHFSLFPLQFPLFNFPLQFSILQFPLLTLSLFTFPFSLFTLNALSAQNDPISATLEVNNVRAVVNSNGALFWDFENGQFLPGGQGMPSTMRATGLWLAGLDGPGNLMGAAQLYNEDDKADFMPGVIHSGTGEPFPLNGTWRVTREDILTHIADYEDNGVIDNPNPNIFGWPGNGNAFFQQYNNGMALPFTTQGLAGYYDLNGDGIYSPSQGDYPIIEIRQCISQELIPDEMLWFAFHDKRAHTESGLEPMNIEVQCLAFAFDCEENNALDNTVFLRFKLINRGAEVRDSTYFGLFSDFDIGNPTDDFLGTDTARSIVYAYNGDNTDENGFGADIPAMAVNLLRGPLGPVADTIIEEPLAHAVPFSATSLSGPEIYNLLSGRFADGAPAPNDGLLYTDYPTDPNGWSEVTAGNTPGERKTVSSFGPFTLFPGAVNELIAAYTFYREPGNSPAENAALIPSQGQVVQQFFDQCFEGDMLCTQNFVVSTRSTLPESDLRLFPNPAAHSLQLEAPSAGLREVRLYDLHGRLLQHWRAEAPAYRHTLRVSELAEGMYVLEVKMPSGKKVIRKVVVQR